MENHQPLSTPLYLLDLEVTVTQPLDENLFLSGGAVGLLRKVDAFIYLPNSPETEEYWLKEDLDKLLLEEKPINLTLKMKALTANPEKLAGHESAFAVGYGGEKYCRLQMKFAKNFEEADFSLLEKEDGFCWRWLPQMIPWGEEFVVKDQNEKSEDLGSKQKVRWFPRKDSSNVKWVKIPNDHPYFQPKVKELNPKSRKKKIGKCAQRVFEARFARLALLKTHLKFCDSLLKTIKERDQEFEKGLEKEFEALREAKILKEEELDYWKALIQGLEAETISLAAEFIRHGFIKEASFLKRIEEMNGKED